MSSFYSSDIMPRQSPNSLKMICSWMEGFSYAYGYGVELCLLHSQETQHNVHVAHSHCALYGSRLLQVDTPQKVVLMKSLIKSCE